jgi:hypothetical protein
MIYGYLGIVAISNLEKKPRSALDKPDARLSCAHEVHGRISYEISQRFGRSPRNTLTRTNHKIRAEILDTLLRLRVIDIECWLAKSITSFYQVHILAEDGIQLVPAY